MKKLLLLLFLLPVVVQSQSLCRIYGKINTTIIDPDSGQFVTVHKVLVNGHLVSAVPKTQKADASGHFSFQAIRGSVVYVSANIPGYQKFSTGVPVTIPDADSAALATLLSASPPTALPIVVDSANFVTKFDYVSTLSDSLDANPRIPEAGTPYQRVYEYDTTKNALILTNSRWRGTVTFTQGSDTLRGHGTRWVTGGPDELLINDYGGGGALLGPDSLYYIDVYEDVAIDDTTALLGGAVLGDWDWDRSYIWQKPTVTIPYSTAMPSASQMGSTSMALGVGTGGASGRGAVAVGKKSVASGNWSLAMMGGNVSGSASKSVAIGDGSSVTAANSTAIGIGSRALDGNAFAAKGGTASGYASTAVGGTASGYSAVAIGGSSAGTSSISMATGYAVGDNSVALNSSATANNSVAIGGLYNEAAGYGSGVIGGSYLKTLGVGSFAAGGIGLIARSDFGAVLGKYNDTTDEYKSLRALTVGYGTNASLRRNAFVVYQNGSVGGSPSWRNVAVIGAGDSVRVFLAEVDLQPADVVTLAYRGGKTAHTAGETILSYAIYSSSYLTIYGKQGRSVAWVRVR